MVFDVIIYGSKKDVETFGKRGTVFLGKQYIQMGQTTSISNPVYMDVVGSHVVFVVGKRGSGKSYSVGSIAEAPSRFTFRDQAESFHSPFRHHGNLLDYEIS